MGGQERTFAQYVQEEYGWLAGGTIVAVRPFDMDLGGWSEEGVVIDVKLEVPIRTDEGLVRVARFEVWQDPEGNGTGYLAFTGKGQE